MPNPAPTHPAIDDLHVFIATFGKQVEFIGTGPSGLQAKSEGWPLSKHSAANRPDSAYVKVSDHHNPSEVAK
jgi:hypothetical protein